MSATRSLDSLSASPQLQPAATAQCDFAHSRGGKAVARNYVGAGILEWASLMLLVVLGSVVRVAAVFQHNPLDIQTTDPGRWWFTATHLSTLQPIAAIDPFGYQLWLGIVAGFSNSSPLAIALHNAALSVLTPWIWHRVLREITGNRDIALVGWAIFCGLPSWISIFSYTMSETLFLPAIGLAIWLSVRFYRTQSNGACYASALAWALASATRIYALPFAVVFLVWSIHKSSQKWMKAGQVLAAFALFVAPLSLRAHCLLHVWHPFGFPEMNQIYMESGKRTLRLDISRNGGSYHWFYEFGSPALYEEPLHPVSHWRSPREGVVQISIDEDRGVADWDRALKANRTSWRQRLRLWAENCVFFSFAPSWPDNSPDRLWDRTAVSTRWIWTPIALVVIFGNLYYGKQLGWTAAGVFAILTTVAWTFTPLLPAIMEGRYRKPVEGLLLVNLLLLIACRRNTRAPQEVQSNYTLPEVLVTAND
ncbi:MAG TPA: glycosyltransferase family 39 protein [Terriglobales bacterium]|nr:glycosyltransferase family 39 protein [Terriglobales bacterium]